MDYDFSDLDWHTWPVIARKVSWRDHNGNKFKRWAVLKLVKRKRSRMGRYGFSSYAYHESRNLFWPNVAFRAGLVAAFVAGCWL